MDGNGAGSGPGSHAADGWQGEPTAVPLPEPDGIWLCPAVVSLNAAEIEAALFAFSDLTDDETSQDLKATRDDLRSIVARYGTALIECAAECLAMSGAAAIPRFIASIGVAPDRNPSADRLALCRQQSLLLLRADAA